MKPQDEVVADAFKAKDGGAFRFCMVMSGRGPSDSAVDKMCETIRAVKEETGLKTCLSVGLMSDDQTRRLKDAGLDRVNHNLNTSEEHYGEVCSTHDWNDRHATLKSARNAGLELCSGYIFGMGESFEDRIDMCLAIRDLAPESVPVNFLLPIEGNRLQVPTGLSPEICLRILCAVRYAAPTSEVRVAAGREYHLKDLQALSLWPANSLFADGYLLSEGDAQDRTIELIHNAGFIPEGNFPATQESSPVTLKESVTR